MVRRLADRVILMTENGLIEQQDETEDLFERIVERKPEKPKQTEKPESDNLFQRRKENKQRRAKAKQEYSRIDQLIRQNEAAKKEAEQVLLEAQNGSDYRRMQQLYETISALDAEEAELYDRLEKAENDLIAIETEDEV
jgi:ABC-type multidrug transport system ATPase subunit